MDRSSRGTGSHGVGGGARQGARLAAVALVVALVGCGHGARTAPASASRGGPLPSLLSLVPADAGFILHVAPGLVERLPDLATTSFRQGMASSEGRDDGPLERALLGDLLRPEPMAPKLGWRVGHSEVVAWAEGKQFVAHARIDGAALRATLERAAAASGRALPRKEWQGQAYLAWPGDDGQTMLARLDDDEAVLMSSTDPDRDLPRLFARGPAARPFDPTPTLTSLFPGRADAHFGLRFDPAWITSVAADELTTEAPNRACAKAVVRWLGRLPAIDYAWASDGATTELATAMRLAAPTAARLSQQTGPIPHWLVTEDLMVMGFGAAPVAVLEATLPLAEELEHIMGSCERPVELVQPLRQLATLPILGEIRGGSFVGDFRTESFAVAVLPADLGRLWSSLRSLSPIPLRAQPPARGERYALPGMVVTSDGTSLLAAQDDDRSRALLAELTSAGDGPTVLAAMAMGEGVLSALAADKDYDSEEEARNARLFWSWFSGMALEVGLRDDRLVSRVILRHR